MKRRVTNAAAKGDALQAERDGGEIDTSVSLPLIAQRYPTCHPARPERVNSGWYDTPYVIEEIEEASYWDLRNDFN